MASDKFCQYGGKTCYTAPTLVCCCGHRACAQHSPHHAYYSCGVMRMIVRPNMQVGQIVGCKAMVAGAKCLSVAKWQCRDCKVTLCAPARHSEVACPQHGGHYWEPISGQSVPGDQVQDNELDCLAQKSLEYRQQYGGRARGITGWDKSFERVQKYPLGGKWLGVDVETPGPGLTEALIARGLGIQNRKEVKRKMDINTLKTFKAAALEVEDLVELETYSNGLVEGFKRNDVSAPDWLTTVQSELKEAIKSRQRDTWEKELKETERQLDQLKTAEEKRVERNARAAELRAKLGK